jgi:hypothetical protein
MFGNRPECARGFEPEPPGSRAYRHRRVASALRGAGQAERGTQGGTRQTRDQGRQAGGPAAAFLAGAPAGSGQATVSSCNTASIRPNPMYWPAIIMSSKIWPSSKC